MLIVILQRSVEKFVLYEKKTSEGISIKVIKMKVYAILCAGLVRSAFMSCIIVAIWQP